VTVLWAEALRGTGTGFGSLHQAPLWGPQFYSEDENKEPPISSLPQRAGYSHHWGQKRDSQGVRVGSLSLPCHSSRVAILWCFLIQSLLCHFVELILLSDKAKSVTTRAKQNGDRLLVCVASLNALCGKLYSQAVNYWHPCRKWMWHLRQMFVVCCISIYLSTYVFKTPAPAIGQNCHHEMLHLSMWGHGLTPDL
jgi:hypothetical protein